MVPIFDKVRQKRVENEDWVVKKLRIEVFCGFVLDGYL